VEEELLRKLQEVTEKFIQTQQERDALHLVSKEHDRKVSELNTQLKDNAFYTSAMEKENIFLR
jgi:hypothetical protein